MVTFDANLFSLTKKNDRIIVFFCRYHDALIETVTHCTRLIAN